MINIKKNLELFKGYFHKSPPQTILGVLILGIIVASIFYFIVRPTVIYTYNKLFTKPNTHSYELKEIIILAENNDVDSIIKIINNTKNDELNKDTYWFTKAIFSIMQPTSSTDDPISCIIKIDRDSKYYRYSIRLACSHLQSSISCETMPNREIFDFAKHLREKGDNSPLVDITYYIESTLMKTKYGIGDKRTFPSHDYTNYRLCLQKPDYYIQAYNNIRKKYENDNFKITYKGAESFNAAFNTTAQIDIIYLHLYKLIGALHGSAAISYHITGDTVNSKKEMQEFVKYYPNGITINEKNAFLITYGSVYLWLLDSVLKQHNVPYQ